MTNFFKPGRPVPSLDADRLNRMIDTALMMKQDVRQSVSVGSLWKQKIVSFFQVISIPLGARATFASIVVIFIVAFATPSSQLTGVSDLDDMAAELNEFLLYDTIEGV